MSGWCSVQADVLLLVVVKASAVVAVVGALAWAARGRSAALRAGLWAAAMGLLLAAPVVVACLPTLPVLPGSVDRVSADAPAVLPSGASAVAMTVAPDVARPAEGVGGSLPGGLEGNAARAGGWGSGFQMGLTGLCLIWLVGVGLWQARWLRHVAAVAHLRRGSCGAPGHVLAVAEAAARAVRCDRGGDVRIADVAVPCLFGLWRATVLLPREANHWDSGRLRRALLHELSHVRRRDYLSHVLSCLACALYWPNPLVWWAARRHAAACEQATDDVVLASGARGVPYAGDLLRLARDVGSGVPDTAGIVGIVGMTSGSPLAERVRAILASRRDRRPLSLTGRAAVLLLVAAGTVPLVLAGRGEGGGDDGLQAVLARLAAREDATRQYAAWRLGEMESRRAVPELIARLADPSPAVRGTAAWALGEIKDRRAVPHLTALLDDGDEGVVDMAVRALGECEAAGAVPLLGRFFATGDARLGAAAAFALGEIGTPEAVDALHRQLRTATDPDVLAALLRALGQRRVKAARADILLCLGAADATVRGAAARALGRIGDESSVARLLPLLRDPEPAVRGVAVWALDEIEAPGS